MQLAPVVLFVYNRPWHTSQTLESLAKNDLADQSKLFIYSDGLKANADKSESANVEEVRKIIRQKKWCKEVTIIESDFNKGLANSIVGGITEIVDQFGKIIVLEDDIVTSKGFLEFMNQGLELYKNEERVMDITGYAFPVKNIQLPEIFFLEMASSWGWGTWNRSWSFFTADTEWLYKELIEKKKWSSFLKIGHDNFRSQLMNNLEGKIHTWAIKWQAVMTLRNGLSLQPGKSLVRNIGFDGTGTNYTANDETFQTDRLSDYLRMEKVSQNEIKEDESIMEIYRSFLLNKGKTTEGNSKRFGLKRLLNLFKSRV